MSDNFEREYMGTFEPCRGPLPPLRPKLAAVLAALTDDDPQWWEWQVKHTQRWDFHARGVVTHGAMLAGARRDGALFWRHESDEGRHQRPITPAEAWEMLAARDLIPLSWTDHKRRFGVRGRVRCYYCPRGTGPLVCTLCDGTKLLCSELGVHPATLEEIVAFASLDPEAVDRAELLALEHVRTARPICWRFGAVDPSLAHALSQAPGHAIEELGFGLALAARDTPLHPYKILVCPPL